MRFSNLHTHTTFSDGKNTPRECINAARALGMRSLGISDHSYTPFDVRYCMRPATHFEKYEETIREEIRVARETDGFPVYLGVEYDFGSENLFENYDYRIGSVHYILREDRMYPVDSGLKFQLDCIEKEFHGNKLDYVKAYFEEVYEHARRNHPDIVGHFDLLTKHGLFDEDDPAYRAVATEALRATVREVPLFEINAGAIIRGLKKLPYPAPFLLRELREAGGRVILSSDAHAADKLIFAFPQILSLLYSCGFTAVSVFDGKAFAEEEIPPEYRQGNFEERA
ncbi:MAG: PHP domain-containing protein [Clostridia bacterium]|nr:PHP domain-containing protein [Clostridia bacterium]MDD7701073.1 PHP domain-containing protein [Eubacteriales bacterium]MDY2826603.1 PHP domain-containing protein [Eubacteriales bacterium]